MSHKAKVTYWRGSWGYVETPDGKVCFVHCTILPEGKQALSVGKEVRVDFEEVDGHQGRVKATRCVGAGLCSTEQAKENGRGGGRRAGGGAHAAAEPTDVERREDSDGQRYTKAEFIAEYGTKEGKRLWGLAEERMDPLDGCWYTKQCFADTYGGFKEWSLAERRPKVSGEE
eukprot:TRINITY_DN28171_c0_g1_i1.p3 TRINITY_DN28171_c0_g1~~TRINITY_DN28171_c0_g1_i1.p3  ORF type:complete len:198 (+),score=61.31 TRINITY_DN28171_c0_g1_i1:80-595(+)